MEKLNVASSQHRAAPISGSRQMRTTKPIKKRGGGGKRKRKPEQAKEKEREEGREGKSKGSIKSCRCFGGTAVVARKDSFGST